MITSYNVNKLSAFVFLSSLTYHIIGALCGVIVQECQGLHRSPQVPSTHYQLLVQKGRRVHSAICGTL